MALTLSLFIALMSSSSAIAQALYDGMTIQCYPRDPKEHKDFYIIRRFFVNEDAPQIGDLMVDLVTHDNPGALRDPEEFGFGEIIRHHPSNYITGKWNHGATTLVLTPKTGERLIEKHRQLKWPHWDGLITFGSNGNSAGKEFIFAADCSVFCMQKTWNRIRWIRPKNHCALTEDSAYFSW